MKALRALLIALEATLLVVALWMALLQVTWLWVQVAPDQVRTWLGWVSGGRVQVERVTLPRNLLLPEVHLAGLRVQTDAFTFHAGRLSIRTVEQDGRLRTHLDADHWQLDLPVSETQGEKTLLQPPDWASIRPHLRLPAWSRLIDSVSVKKGVIRRGLWQVVMPEYQLQRQARQLTGEGPVQLIYDRVPVWQGEVSLVAGLDWRQRIDSGTVEWRMVRPTALADLAPLLQTRWRRGEAWLEGALRYKDGWPRLDARFRLDGLGARAGGVNSLGALLRWRARQGVGLFTIEQWMINGNQLANQAPATVRIGHNSMTFSLPSFHLDSFRGALEQLWPQWPWQQTRLRIEGLALRYQLRPFRLQRLAGTVEELAWPAEQLQPGVRLRKLHLSGSPWHLVFRTDEPISLQWHGWRKPEHQLRLDDAVVFSRQADGWVMRPLRFQFDAMAGLLHWRGHLEAGAVRLRLAPEDMNGVKRLLPSKLLSPKLDAWLHEALVSGKVAPVELSYSGPWRKAFERGSGLEVVTQVEDAVLKFRPEWPPLRQMSAQLRYTPHMLQIALDRGRIAQASIGPVTARIGPLDGPGVALQVDGRVSTTADGLQAFFLSTPLLHQLSLEGVLGPQLDFRGGKVAGRLQLWVPLAGYPGRRVDVGVDAQLSNVTARLPGGLEARQLSGRVRVAHSRSVSGRLQGTLFGRPLTVRLADGAGGALRIEARGHLPVARYLADARGWLKWAGHLEVPTGGDAPLRFRLDGRAYLRHNGLPAPLDQALMQPVALRGQYGKGLLQAYLMLGRENWLWGQWRRQGDRLPLERGVVIIGGTASDGERLRAGGEKGLKVRITAGEVDLGHWQRWWSAQQARLPLQDAGGSLPALDLTLHAERARYARQVFDQLQLSARSEDEARIAFSLKARQADLSGVLIPHSRQLVISARHLTLVRPETTETAQCTSWGRPNDFKLFFTGERVSLEGRLLEKLRFNLYADPAQVRIESVDAQAEAGAIRLTGNLNWAYQENQTRLEAQMTSNDVQRFLAWAGFKDPGFTGEKARVETALSWPGPPDCFALEALSGRIDFRLDDGVIEQARPGLAKVFALLSVDSLLRNIKVTVGTLQYQGMVYSKIEGDIRIKKGWGHVRRIFLDAPALQAEMKGGVDLIRRRFDLKAKVTPQLGGTLTTLLSVFGLANPLTAVSTYLFLKNLPGANPNLISYRYHIVGPWSAPRIINLDSGEVVGEKKSPQPPQADRFDEILSE